MALIIVCVVLKYVLLFAHSGIAGKVKDLVVISSFASVYKSSFCIIYGEEIQLYAVDYVSCKRSWKRNTEHKICQTTSWHVGLMLTQYSLNALEP